MKLFLLGPPRLEQDGVPIQVDTRKAIALLAYLAATGQVQRRDSLAGLLWPDSDQTRARAALRRTLSSLNRAMDGRGLKIDRETIGLDDDSDLWIDLARFKAHLAECLTHSHASTDVCGDCVSPLSSVVEAYQGEFLAGFALRDSPAFDDWQFAQSESLRRELGSALERLTRQYASNREFENAISLARRSLTLDPLDESAHRRLMQLDAWAGRRTDAMRQYRECVRILDQELGVAPLEETTFLYEAIRENKVAPPPTIVTSSPEPTSKSEYPAQEASGSPIARRPSLYPLVGRSAEWDTLLEAYKGIGADGHLIALEGEAGIGKTRLAEEFLEHFRSRGAAVVTARCYEGEASLAYAPFAEGIRSALGRDAEDRLRELPDYWVGELARLLPDLTSLRPNLSSLPPLDSPGAQSRFFEAISQALMTICEGHVPGVLFIDDLHWCDESSLDLLSYLVRRLAGKSLCIVTAWRSEHVSNENRIRLILAEARRSGSATHVSLERLDSSAVTELVRTSITDDLLKHDGIEERLYRETDGLPFFLVEYLTQLQVGSDPDWGTPSGVQGLLHSRLAPVSETARQILDTAAVIGRSFDFDTLRDTSGRSDEETVNALEEIVSKGLVREVEVGTGQIGLTYDFSHDQLRSLVYAESSAARRRLLHRRAAESLSARSGRVHEAGPIAQHYRLAGLNQDAAEYFKLAGDYARSLFANAEALSHFQTALMLDHPESIALHEAIGDVLTLLGEYGRAIISYETAAGLAQTGSTSALEHKLGGVYLRRGQWDLAESHYEAAEVALGTESELLADHARLYADWGLVNHHKGDSERSLEMATRAVEIAESVDDPRGLAQAHNVLGIILRQQGDLEGARSHLESSLTLAETLGDPTARVAALNNLALAFNEIDDFNRAIELEETALQLCVSQGDRHREAAVHNNLADFLHAAGSSDAAMDHLKEAVAIFAEIGTEEGDMQPEIWKLVEW